MRRDCSLLLMTMALTGQARNGHNATQHTGDPEFLSLSESGVP